MDKPSAKKANREKQILRASKNGDATGVQELLAGDHSLIHFRDKDGSTPLHWAAWRGRREVAEVLLKAGAKVNAHNQNAHWGTTPLHAAAHGNQERVAKLLLAHGADIRAKNLNGRTPLGETAVHNAKAVAALLRERGATN